MSSKEAEVNPPPYPADPGTGASQTGLYPAAQQAPYPTQPVAQPAKDGAHPAPPYTTNPNMGQPAMIVYTQPFGRFPQQMTCHGCHASIMTTTQLDYGLATWLAAGVCCVFGGFCGCCLIPFCVDAAKDVHHTCPNCTIHLGTAKVLE